MNNLYAKKCLFRLLNYKGNIIFGKLVLNMRLHERNIRGGRPIFG
jgi:hypothetical protein